MGGINVKNTIVERALHFIAPHPCYGCGKVGVILCDYCKYDIVHEPFLACIACQTPNPAGICANHHSPLKKVFIVGKRTDALETAINGLKFSNVKACAQTLAELLDEALPILPVHTKVVPIPTINRHIRQRGYDQVELIAKHFAHLRGLDVIQPLKRLTTTVQHTASREDREKQAQSAFGLRDGAETEGLVLLIDDIITTGSTLSSAANILSSTGMTVWAAALAYQPLD